jgi:hypothetical protein
MTTFMRGPPQARRVLEDVGHRAPDREVPAELLPIGKADDQQVRLPFHRLVDDRGPDVPSLDEDGLQPAVEVLRGRLGRVEHALGALGALGHAGVEGEGPVDLDHVDRHDFGLRRAGGLDHEPDDSVVTGAAVERDDNAREELDGLVGHGARATSGQRWVGPGEAGRDG